MYKTINYCDNLIEYWGPALCIYIVPGILFVWAMARMASRNPKYQTVSDEPKAGFFKQCLWILIAMFGGVFVVDKTTHEQFKRHRIVPKAIGVWFVLISIIVLVFGDNKLAFRNAYEMAVKNNTMEIYSGDAQLRAFPSCELHLLLSRIKKLLSFLGVAMYIWYYKPSPTSIWFKARKVIGLFMLYFAYTALVVVYTPFDLMVFGIILLISTLLLIDYRKEDKRNASVVITEEVVSSMPIPLEESGTPINETNNSNMEQNSHVEKVEEMPKEEIQPIIEQESLDIKSDDKKIQATPSSKPQSKRQALMKKIVRYAKFVIIIGGTGISVLAFTAYSIDTYDTYGSLFPKMNARKAVDDIIYKFEYGNKDVKYKIAANILEYCCDWKEYEGVADWHIRSLLEGKDYAEIAFNYVESMAYSGDVDCQFLLGLFYCNGYYNRPYKDDFSSSRYPTYYTEYNIEKAAYWFHEAAKQDHPVACNFIGIFYKEGRGVTIDEYKTVAWLSKGAELGDPYAQVNYGDLLAEGVSLYNGYTFFTILKKDVEMARYWWKKAAEQGDERAKDRLQKIYE